MSEGEITRSRPLSIRETARLMRRREEKVTALIEAGRLRFIQQGRSRYVLPEDARAYLRDEAQVKQVRRRRKVKRQDIDPLLAELLD